MTGLTYTTFVSTVQNLAVIPAGDPNFATDLPSIIDDAELRCYRALDLLNTFTTATGTLATATRSFAIPSTNGTFVVTESFNVITPAGTTNPDQGTRNALVPVSREVVNFLWPSSTGSTVPLYMAPLSQSAWLVAPWPDAAYTVEVVGTIRPSALSSSNVTTLLSVYFPDLLVAASMTRVAAYLKNYGAAVDDPKMGPTWDAHFMTLLQSAEVEENRKKFASAAWSSKNPTPLATPARA